MAFMGLQGEPLATARIFLIVLPAFLLFGYNQSSLGGVLAFKSFTKTYPRIDTTNTKGALKAENARIQGTVVAIYTLGCLIGAIASTQVGNRIGRRATLVIFAGITTIGIIIQTSSYSLAQLIVGRIIGGIGVGGVNAIVPVWQSECTKPRSRGKNVVVLGVFIATGIAAASWVNYGLSFVQTSSVSWRLPMAIPLIFVAMLFAFTYSFPESPRWLVSKSRNEDARSALTIISGSNADPEVIDIEIRQFAALSHNDLLHHRGFLSLLKPGKDKLPYRLFLAIAVNFCAQMTGANVITYYATTIFTQSLHFPSHQASLLSAGVLTWKIVAAFTSFLTVDRFGRRPLFMVAGIGMAVSFAGLAGTVSDINNKAAGGAAVFFLFLFMAFFPLGFLGANFLYAAEIAPQDLRVHLAGIGTATHWLFNFVIAEITPVAFVTIGYRYYIVYACIGASVAPLVYFMFPETKGKSLEEMGRMFEQPEHFWQVPTFAKNMQESELTRLENEGKGNLKGFSEQVEDVGREEEAV